MNSCIAANREIIMSFLFGNYRFGKITVISNSLFAAKKAFYGAFYRKFTAFQ